VQRPADAAPEVAGNRVARLSPRSSEVQTMNSNDVRRSWKNCRRFQVTEALHAPGNRRSAFGPPSRNCHTLFAGRFGLAGNASTRSAFSAGGLSGEAGQRRPGYGSSCARSGVEEFGLPLILLNRFISNYGTRFYDPGRFPVLIEVPEGRARLIRVTATRLYSTGKQSFVVGRIDGAQGKHKLGGRKSCYRSRHCK